jgi:hypothetical protein
MTEFSNGRASLKLVASRNWMFETEPYSRIPQKTYGEAGDDIRLKRVLKRAVMRDEAPQSLIGSIKFGIRG